MKKKQPTDDLTTDDDILREQGMADGPTTVAGIDLRPITALSVSWMQRNEMFSDEKDLIWRAAAFAFLHSEPFTRIREVVNDRAAFVDAVDCWIEENMQHHSETQAIAKAMNSGFARYMSSVSEQTGGKKAASGN